MGLNALSDRKRAISEQVVVVTGASSGIGRECVVELVSRGATVVATARNREALDTLASSLSSARGRIETIVADVADWKQVEKVAKTTIERFGRIDTWVNNAGVAMFASVASSTVEEIERVISVNLLGQIHGMKAALPHMTAQRGGTLINVGSVESWRAVPLQSAYAASKHGLKAFTEALRMELQHERTGVDVVLISPAAINTPIYENARSKLGVKPRAVPPVYDPRAVVDAIVFAAEHPRRDITVGGAGAALILLQRLSPRLLDWYMVSNGRFFRKQMTRQPDDGVDNLFEPSRGPGAVRGSFGHRAFAGSLYTRVFEYHPWRKVAAAALVVPWVVPALLAALPGIGLGALALKLFGPLVRRASKRAHAPDTGERT